MKVIRTYLFVVLAMLSISGKAQSSMYYYQPVNTWEFGPRVGFTTSIINSKGDPSIKTGIKWGLVGGVFGRYQLADQWAINVDLSYSTRGNKNDFANVEFGFVDFSVAPLRNVKYRMFKQDMTFDFFIGPGLSVLTTAVDKASSSANIEEEISKVGFNIVVGGGFPIGPVILYATTRIGLSNLLTNPVQGSKWLGLSTEWTIAYRLGRN